MCHILALLAPSNLQAADKLKSSSREENYRVLGGSQDVRAWIGSIGVIRDYSFKLVNSSIQYCSSEYKYLYSMGSFVTTRYHSLGKVNCDHYILLKVNCDQYG